MNLSRRSLLTGLITAPLVVRTPGILMPVRTWHNGIRGQIMWVADRRFDGGHYPVSAVISDGRRWRPYDGLVFPP